MYAKDVVVIILTLLSAAAFLLDVVLNGMAARGQVLYQVAVGNVSAQYPTFISVAGYNPYSVIWGIAFVWSGGWIIYALSGMHRKNVYGLVLLNPLVLTIPVQICWILACVCNIVWLVVWSRKEFLASFLVMFVFSLCLSGALAFLVFATESHGKASRKESEADFALIYILIQNGIDVLLSLTTVNTLVNLSVFMIYDPIVQPAVSDRTASIVCLSILLGLVVLWSVLENTVFFKYVKYLFAWYGVVIWSAVEILLTNQNLENPNVILTITIICTALVCAVIKLVVFRFRVKSLRSKRYPVSITMM